MKKFLEIVLFILVLIGILSLGSCEKQEIPYYPCIDGDCGLVAIPDPVSQPNAWLDSNNYWHLNYEGSKYFALVLKYDMTKKLNGGGQPYITTEYSTDTWLINLGEYKLWSSRYNPLGSDYTQNFQMALANEVVEVSIPSSEITEMMNMSGQYYRECFSSGCGLGPEPKVRANVGHRSKAIFTYFPEQAQVHDTITVQLKTWFGSSEMFYEDIIVKNEIKIIL